MKFEKSEVAGSNGMSRRRDVRVEPPPRLTVALAGRSGRQVLRDISVSGLCVEMAGPLEAGSIHRLTLVFGCIVVTRRARTVYCRPAPDAGWLMGMEFLADPSREQWTIDDLVNRLLSASISFS